MHRPVPVKAQATSHDAQARLEAMRQRSAGVPMAMIGWQGVAWRF